MAWRDTARWCGMALTVLSFSVVGTVRPASAQEIEAHNSPVCDWEPKPRPFWQKYGNPNQVVIGDIGVRQSPLSGNSPGAQGSGGEEGGGGGGSSWLPLALLDFRAGVPKVVRAVSAAMVQVPWVRPWVRRWEGGQMAGVPRRRRPWQRRGRRRSVWRHGKFWTDGFATCP